MNVDVSSTKVILGLIHDMGLAYCSPFVMLVVVKVTGVNECYWHARCRELSLIIDAHSRSSTIRHQVEWQLHQRIQIVGAPTCFNLAFCLCILRSPVELFSRRSFNLAHLLHTILKPKVPLPEVLTSLWRKI